MKQKYLVYGGLVFLGIVLCVKLHTDAQVEDSKEVSVIQSTIESTEVSNEEATIKNSVQIPVVKLEPEKCLALQSTLKKQEEVKEEIKIKIIEGFVTCRVNVREQPSKNSNVVKTMSYGDVVEGELEEGSKWIKIKDGYIYSEYVSEEELDYKDYEAPQTSGFKSYMGHSLFSAKSKQEKLQESATTSSEGIRIVDGRYCVALGSGYTTNIGQYFDLVLENGTVIPCILADGKDDCHTDRTNRITESNGCMSEFVVDLASLDSKAKRTGDVSYCHEEWQSPVSYVRIYEQNYLE